MLRQRSSKPRFNVKLIIGFLLLIGSAIAYFTFSHPAQASAVGNNRQYAVEEFPSDTVINADYGSATTKKTRGGGGGGKKGGGRTKPSKAPKVKKTKAPKPTKAPKVKPTKAPDTSDPTQAPKWPTGKPTNKPSPSPTWPAPKPAPINAPGLTCADGAKGVLSSSGTLDDFSIGIDIDCEEEKVTVSITKESFSETWFGIVFSDEMIGTSLIYTMGNRGAKETDRPLSLYQYENKAKSSKKVTWDSSIKWMEEQLVRDGDKISVVYTADIAGSPIDLDTKDVDIRYAVGPNNYNIEYHTSAGRSNGVLNLSLVSK